MQSVDTQLVTTHKHYVSRRFSRIKTCQLNKTAQQNKISPPEYRWPTKIKIIHQNIYTAHQNKDSPPEQKITHQHIKSTRIKIAHQNPLDLASSWFSTLANICMGNSETLLSHRDSTFSKPMSLTTAVSNITLVVLFKPYLFPWPVEHSAKNTTIYICHLKVYTSYTFL